MFSRGVNSRGDLRAIRRRRADFLIGSAAPYFCGVPKRSLDTLLEQNLSGFKFCAVLSRRDIEFFPEYAAEIAGAVETAF